MTTFTEIVLAQVATTGDHAPNVAMLAAGVMADAIIEILADPENKNAAIEAAALGRCVKKLREKYSLTPHQPHGRRVVDVPEFSDQS